MFFSEDTKLVSDTFMAPMCQQSFMCLCPLPPPCRDSTLLKSKNVFIVLFVSLESTLVAENVC